jgi:hypothetical protein
LLSGLRLVHGCVCGRWKGGGCKRIGLRLLRRLLLLLWKGNPHWRHRRKGVGVDHTRCCKLVRWRSSHYGKRICPRRLLLLLLLLWWQRRKKRVGGAPKVCSCCRRNCRYCRHWRRRTLGDDVIIAATQTGGPLVPNDKLQGGV